MYESFYKLHPSPFRLTPDPRYFFKSPSHKRGLAYLHFAAQQSEGIVVITGQPGTGKTALMLNYLSLLPASRFTYAKLVSTNLAANDFLLLIGAAFHLSPENGSKAMLLKHLEAFFIAQVASGKQVLLVVDEAQNLLASALNELSMLTNFQLHGSPLLQCILLGQESLTHNINDPRLAHLKQRIIASSHLEPLNQVETQHYIEHRLRLSHWLGDPVFSNPVYQMIQMFSGGIPRKINFICHRLLLQAYLDELHTITPEMTWTIIRELQDETIIDAISPAVVTSHHSVVQLPQASQSLNNTLEPVLQPVGNTAIETMKYENNDNVILKSVNPGLVSSSTDGFSNSKQDSWEMNRATHVDAIVDTSKVEASKYASPTELAVNDTAQPMSALTNPAHANVSLLVLPQVVLPQEKSYKYIDNTAGQYQHTVKRGGSGFMDKELRGFAAIYEKQQAKQSSDNTITQARQTNSSKRVVKFPKSFNADTAKPLFLRSNRSRRALKQGLFWGVPLLLIVVMLNLGYTDKYLKKIEPLLPAGQHSVTTEPDKPALPGDANKPGPAQPVYDNPGIPAIIQQLDSEAIQAVINPLPWASDQFTSAPAMALANRNVQHNANAKGQFPITGNRTPKQQQPSTLGANKNSNAITSTSAHSTPQTVENRSAAKEAAQTSAAQHNTETVSHEVLDASVTKNVKIVRKPIPVAPLLPNQTTQLQVQKVTVIAQPSTVELVHKSPQKAYPKIESGIPKTGTSVVNQSIQQPTLPAEPNVAAVIVSNVPQHPIKIASHQPSANLQQDNQSTPEISATELNALLSTLARAYENGNITQLISVFANDFQSKTASTRTDVESDYKRLFNITDMRRMNLRNARWSENDNIMHGEAAFDIKVREKGASRITAYNGVLRVDVKKGVNGAVIKNLDYLYSRDH